MTREIWDAAVNEDPAVCRRQFPDGSVPGNAREAAEGWFHWYHIVRWRNEAGVACLRHIHDRLIDYPEFETLRMTINAEIRCLLGNSSD